MNRQSLLLLNEAYPVEWFFISRPGIIVRQIAQLIFCGPENLLNRIAFPKQLFEGSHHFAWFRQGVETTGLCKSGQNGLTLPIAKARGFLFQRIQPLQTVVLHILHKRRFPHVLRYIYTILQYCLGLTNRVLYIPIAKARGLTAHMISPDSPSWAPCDVLLLFFLFLKQLVQFMGNIKHWRTPLITHSVFKDV